MFSLFLFFSLFQKNYFIGTLYVDRFCLHLNYSIFFKTGQTFFEFLAPNFGLHFLPFFPYFSFIFYWLILAKSFFSQIFWPQGFIQSTAQKFFLSRFYPPPNFLNFLVFPKGYPQDKKQ